MKGQKRLLSIVKQAQSEYNGPKNSYVWSRVYYYTRVHSTKFDHFLAELDIFPDPIIRMQDFQKFISVGNWQSTSGNTRLFLGLIRD